MGRRPWCRGDRVAGDRGGRATRHAIETCRSRGRAAGGGDRGGLRRRAAVSGSPSGTGAPPPSSSTVAPSIEPTRTPEPIGTLAPTPVPSDGQTPGETRTDAYGIEQVWVPAGTFQMGTSPDEIAALTAASPPPWVVEEFASEGPRHEVTLTKGFWIDTYEVTNAAFAAFVDAGGYANQALWSDDGRAWLAGRDVAKLPIACRGERADASAAVRDLVRGRGVCDVARRTPADRGRMGVRRARTGFRDLPVGARLRRRARQRDQHDRREAGRQLSRWRELGRRARHGRQRDGVGRGLARTSTTTRRARRSIRRVPRPARSRSRRAVGGAAIRSSPAPPIGTSRIRRTTATSTSASGSPRSNQEGRAASVLDRFPAARDRIPGSDRPNRVATLGDLSAAPGGLDRRSPAGRNEPAREIGQWRKHEQP